MLSGLITLSAKAGQADKIGYMRFSTVAKLLLCASCKAKGCAAAVRLHRPRSAATVNACY